MSLDLGSLLQGQLGGLLEQFLTANGEAAENSGRAAGLAVPAVIAGLVKHVSGNPGNASGLIDLITGESGSQLNNVLSQAATGEGVGKLLELGKTLLPNLLGGNAADVADQIAGESGISKASAGSLLSLALPLVLSVLRGKAQSEQLGGAQVLGLLGQQQGWLSQVLGGEMLSALGIGSLSGLFGGLSNLSGHFGGSAAAATAAAAAKGGAGKWVVLALAALAALFAFKSCGQPSEPAASAPAAASAASESPASAEAASAPVEASAPAMEASAPAQPAVSEASAASAPAAVQDEAARAVLEDGVAKFFFATGKNDVAEGAETVVAEVINAGKEGKKLVVSGYADSTGNAAANEALSKKRAQAVQAFLEANGVKAENIELRKPESTTGAVGDNQEGRRVEVKVEG